MTNLDDQQKLRADLLKDDLDAYRKLENWGSSLFLGALGLIGKQLLEWDGFAATSGRVILDPLICTVPAWVGLTAFVFLRIVNFRGHGVAVRLHVITGADNGQRSIWSCQFGLLGLLLAIMPLASGYAISWYLGFANPARQEAMWAVRLAGSLVVPFFLLVHFVCRIRECRK